MYAIIKAGGRQAKVAEGDTVQLPKRAVQVGEEIVLEPVLLIGGEDTTHIGHPAVEDAQVSAKVLGHGRGQKVIVFKKKRRKGYQKIRGHRQDYTEVLITSIQYQ